MSTPTSSHAYGIGVIALIVGMSASLVFYTSFYLPESLLKPSVSEHILEPEETYIIKMVVGAGIEGNDNYIPKKATITLEDNNRVIWENEDDTAHTVTPDHRYADSYSGAFDSPGVIKPGDSYEFLFTEPAKTILYHCIPHPWMTGEITIGEKRF